jgi:hypothetical protein
VHVSVQFDLPLGPAVWQAAARNYNKSAPPASPPTPST